MSRIWTYATLFKPNPSCPPNLQPGRQLLVGTTDVPSPRMSLSSFRRTCSATSVLQCFRVQATGLFCQQLQDNCEKFYVPDWNGFGFYVGLGSCVNPLAAMENYPPQLWVSLWYLFLFADSPSTSVSQFLWTWTLHPIDGCPDPVTFRSDALSFGCVSGG